MQEVTSGERVWSHAVTHYIKIIINTLLMLTWWLHSSKLNIALRIPTAHNFTRD